MRTFIFFYTIYSLCLALKTVAGGCEEFYPLSIVKLYEDTDMNMFGCVLDTLFLILLNPIYSIGRMIYCFIYWLCHVGRK